MVKQPLFFLLNNLSISEEEMIPRGSIIPYEGEVITLIKAQAIREVSVPLTAIPGFRRRADKMRVRDISTAEELFSLNESEQADLASAIEVKPEVIHSWIEEIRQILLDPSRVKEILK